MSDDTNVSWVDPDNSTCDDLIKRAQAAWASVKRTNDWESWKLIGFALDAAQRDICRSLAINQPSDGGRRYARQMSEWLTKYGFDDVDKGVRSRLIQLVQHLPDVESWRASLTLKKRLELNHPSSVWRGWENNPYKRKKNIVDIATVDPKDAMIEAQQKEIEGLRGVIETFECEAREREAHDRVHADNAAWAEAGEIAGLRRRTEAAEAQVEVERKAARDQILHRRGRGAEAESDNVILRERIAALEALNRALAADNTRLREAATPPRPGRRKKTDPNAIAVGSDAVARTPPPPPLSPEQRAAVSRLMEAKTSEEVRAALDLTPHH